MHGNVFQWCSDWYGPYPKGPVQDPHGPPSGEERVLRGGAADVHPPYCRSARRRHRDPLTNRHYTHGFRVACDVSE